MLRNFNETLSSGLTQVARGLLCIKTNVMEYIFNAFALCFVCILVSKRFE